MTAILIAAGNLIGVAVALIAAAVGFFNGIGIVPLIFRAAIVGVAGAVVFRVLGMVVVRALVMQAERDAHRAPAERTPVDDQAAARRAA